MQDLSDIHGLIWDMDGTLYRYDDAFKNACNHAGARTAIKIRPEYTYEYALDQCVISEEKYGFCLYWFHQETNISFDEMHFIFHEALDEKIIQRNDHMSAALRGLKQDSVLLTNASRDWAARVMAHLSLGDIFAPATILALEDFGFQPKGRSVAGFEKALSVLDMPAHNVLMVEDLPRNLVKAKEAGLKTALVHHGKIPDDTSYADYLFQDALELASAFAA